MRMCEPGCDHQRSTHGAAGKISMWAREPAAAPLAGFGLTIVPSRLAVPGPV